METYRDRGVYLIGLGGLKGSGKSTVAQMLVQSFEHGSPYAATVVTLAGPLKMAVAAMLGNPQINVADVPGDQHDKNLSTDLVDDAGNIITLRDLYKKMGTEVGRGISSTLWLQLLKRKLNRLPNQGGLRVVIVPDCRFPNEVDFINSNGGVTYKMPLPPGYDDLSPDNHASEASIHSCHFCVEFSEFDKQKGAPVLWSVATSILRLAASDLEQMAEEQRAKQS